MSNRLLRCVTGSYYIYSLTERSNLGKFTYVVEQVSRIKISRLCTFLLAQTGSYKQQQAQKHKVLLKSFSNRDYKYSQKSIATKV